MASDVIERLRYYQRQYLGAEDFTAEQDYQRSMRRRHNLGPHTWGIVAGLELVEVENAAGGVDLYVMPGMAIDGFGREILVLEPARLQPGQLQRFQGQPGTYGLWVGFEDELAGRARAGFTGCEEGDPFGRVRETFQLVVEPRQPTHEEITIAGQSVGFNPGAAPADPSAEVAERLTVPADESVPHQQLPDDAEDPRWLVQLGVVTWDGGKLVADEADPPVKHQGRRWVSVIAEQVLAPGGRLALRHRDAPQPLPADAADPHHPGVAVELQGSLTVNRTVEADEDVHVRGHVGIGTADPEVRLHVVGGVDATLDAASGYVTVGATTGRNLVLDPNEVQARDAGAAATLHLQARGGDLVVHQEQVDARVIVAKDTGRVGIGTLTPKAKLHVLADADAELAEEESGLLVLGDTAATNLVLDDNEIMARNAGAKASLHLQAEGGDLVVHQRLAATRRLVVKDDGKVGLGTAAPRVMLHVEGGRDVALGEDDGYLVLGAVDGPNVAFDDNEIQARDNGAEAALYLNREGGGLFVHHGQAESRQVAVTSLGRVGIGVQAPRAPLHVRTGTAVTANTKSQGFLILGDDDGPNLAFDDNEIQAKNDGAAATLHLQADGGRLEAHFNRAASERFVVTETGSVGIGTGVPNAKLQVIGSVRASNYLNNSDARLKQGVRELGDAVATLARLRGIRFEWRPELAEELGLEPGPQLGFVAQEVEAVCPEAVDTDTEGMKSIRPHAFLPLLVEAVKELAAEQEALEGRLRKVEEALAERREG